MIDDDDGDDAPLTELILHLSAAGFDVRGRKYRPIREAALDRRYPAYQGENGHWRFKPKDTAKIARALGLKRTVSEDIAA